MKPIIIVGTGLAGSRLPWEDGVEALYYANNSLEGFALTGSAV